MSKLPLSVVLGLAVSVAAACGPEFSHGSDALADHPQAGGNGGAAATGGSGGAVVAAGGNGGNGDAASDAGLGGTGGADDAGPVDASVDTTIDGGVDVPPPTCGPDGHGCA